jgi:hypothetical protein
LCCVFCGRQTLSLVRPRRFVAFRFSAPSPHAPQSNSPSVRRCRAAHIASARRRGRALKIDRLCRGEGGGRGG